MFENFDLNCQNFIEELKIVKELQNYRNNLKKWHAYHKENIDGLKTKKFDPHLPIASSKILKRYLGYKYLLDVEKEAIVKVMFLHTIYIEIVMNELRRLDRLSCLAKTSHIR
jgi:hypothetical protein